MVFKCRSDNGTAIEALTAASLTLNKNDYVARDGSQPSCQMGMREREARPRASRVIPLFILTPSDLTPHFLI